MFFDIQPEDESIIKVIGVGGGGSNAVNFMYKQGITGVNFVICNTDQQALASSEVPNKIQLGPSLTGGRGAGAKPDVGKEATIESEEEIRKALGHNTQMVFITAGMGGGTGTGGAPIVAKIAKDMGILTVGIVTIPFSFEGKSKREKAESGLDELKQNVDSIIVISNNKLREIYGNLSLSAAFSHADNILTTAARGISEIITKPGQVNVDFEDVKTVMRNSGVAIMGIGVAEGEGRATKAIDAALASPLLDDADIYGARGILLYISSGSKEVTMDEIHQITDYVQQAANNDTEIIWGVCHDDNLEDEVSVTLIATGFSDDDNLSSPKTKEVEKLVVKLETTPVIETASTQRTVEVYNTPIKREEAPIANIDNSNDAFSFEFPSEKVEPIQNSPIFTIKHVSQNESPISQKPEIEPTTPKMNDRGNFNNDIIRRKIGGSKLSDPVIQEMENTPSYLRKNKKFENMPHSSQSHLSRYSIVDSFEEENGNTLELKKNSFLSDKPD
ncbi:MAG: cell division protein FtsZ [Chitinophagales bacterium]|nr:cell division protein FtsZ [Chitinophagales bacterium]